MQSNLADIELFSSIVDEGGISAAARALGLSKSAISTRLTRLESRLSTRLLERTTRRVRLTDAGMAYYRRCSEILAAVTEADDEVSRLQNTVVGRLRITAPVAFGRRYMGEPIAAFLAANPQVDIELNLSERTVNLIDEGFDVAIRSGKLADSTLVSRVLLDSRRLAVAAHSYLRKAGTPQNPAELTRHSCLLYEHQYSGDSWIFEAPGASSVRVKVDGRLRTNNGDALAEAACYGAGIALLPDFIAQPFVREGRLQVVLDEYCQVRAPVRAVSPQRRYVPMRIRLFLDELSKHLQRQVDKGW